MRSMYSSLLVLVVVVAVCWSASPTHALVIQDDYFNQDFSLRWQYTDQVPAANWGSSPFTSSVPVTQLTEDGSTTGSFYALTKNKLFRFEPNATAMTDVYAWGDDAGTDKAGKFTRLDNKYDLTLSSTTRVLDLFEITGKPGFAVADSSSFCQCSLADQTCDCLSLKSAGLAAINDVEVVPALPQELHESAPISAAPGVLLATDVGLLYVDLSTSTATVSTVFTPPKDVQADWVNVTALLKVAHTVTETGKLLIATSNSHIVWRYDIKQRSINNYWRFYRTPGIIEGPPTGLAFDLNDTLWIPNCMCVNQQLKVNLAFHRVGGMEGLPSQNLTSVSVGKDGAVWLGSVNGAIRYKQGHWDYYSGPRWLPTPGVDTGNEVLAVAALTGADSLPSVGVVATETGLSLMGFHRWNLEEKAQWYQRMVYPRHDRFGLTAPCTLQTFGNVSDSAPQDSDNDGLWTSMYLVSQAFRYATTGSEDARTNAWTAFEGLEFLNNVTGIKGLIARSVLHQTANPNYGTWHNSSVYPGWIWKGDASSDEVSGHLLAYPVMYKLVAQTASEKARVARLLQDLTNYIVDNDYFLIDVTGTHTEWGIWNPTFINGMEKYYDQRGLNSLQMLAWITSSWELFQEEKMLSGFKNLTEFAAYDTNLINMKITQPSDDNYSDDELTYMPILTYIFSKSSLIDTSSWNTALQRLFKVVKPNKSSLWNIITAMSETVSDPGLEDAGWCLRTWPTSQVNWPFQNTYRYDTVINDQLATRQGQPSGYKVFPYDEQGLFHWNGSPFNLENTGGGTTEYEPTAFLLPYWLGRFHGYITPPN